MASAFGIAGKPVYDALANEPAPARAGVKKLAMAVDLRKFAANPALMNKCVAVCDKIHNVPKIPDKKREVKWIWKETFSKAFVERENELLPESVKKAPVLLLCNHCDHPPCVKVCPTKATWKREEDGVVMMDWHRCIGCRYCMAACPYGSRSFNWMDPRPYVENINSDFPTRTKGVVEKCDFCEERLAVGKLPACVEACENDELIFGDLNDPKSKIRQTLSRRFSIRRKPELGTGPEVYYLL